MKTMKLGEALALLKSKKSRLAKLQEQRLSSFYVSVGHKPSFKYIDLTKQIKAESKDVLALKMGIIQANLNNKIVGDELSIQEAILKVGELRSALNNLEQIVKAEEGSRSYRFSEDKEIVKTPQELLVNIDKTVQELAHKKTLLDTKIQDANWRVDVEVDVKA